MSHSKKKTLSKFSALPRVDRASIIVIAIAIALGLFMLIKPKFTSPPKISPSTESSTSTPNTNLDNHTVVKPAELKSTVTLKVPFTAQAPTSNWDELHNEACEEASAIMAYEYFIGNKQSVLPAKDVETEISKLTNWQTKNQGYNLDQTSPEVAKMVQSVYNLKVDIAPNFDEPQIKQALNDGNLIIISFNGRLLGNPNYKAPGPVHHMMVITGYDSKGFIANDPGTKKGQNYHYTYDILHTAAAEWSQEDKTTHADQKIALIISKSN